MKTFISILMQVWALSFICNYSSHAQSWQWAKSIGGIEFDQVNAVVVDSSANSYITGNYYGSISFGDWELNAIGDSDAYLAKFDANGNVLWAVSAGGAGFDEGKALSLDRFGNIYLGGVFSQNSEFGKHTLRSKGGLDVFLVKYNVQGEVQKVANVLNTVNRDNITALGCDHEGNVYLLGEYDTLLDQNEVYLTRLESNDLAQSWIQLIGGRGSQSSQDLAVDAKGNCFVTGSFEGSILLDNHMLKAAGSNDFFVAKYRADGTSAWANHVKAAGFAQLNAISTDGLGNCYLVGNFDYSAVFGNVVLKANGVMDALYVKYNAHGMLTWAKQSANSGKMSATALATNQLGESYVAGRLDGTGVLGRLTIGSGGKEASYVAKLDQSGEPVWAIEHGVITSNYVSDITLDHEGNSYLIGQFYGESHVENAAVLTSSMEYDGYLARLDDDLPCKQISVDLAVSNAGSSHALIQWGQATADAYEYRYRKLPHGSWAPANRTSDNQVNLSNLEAGQEYVFHIRAYCKQSLADNAYIQFQTKTLATCNAAPENIMVTNITTSSVTVTWDATNSEGLVGYNFRIRKPDGSWSQGFANDAVMNLTGLESEAQYEFIVNNRCLNGTSSPTSILFSTGANTLANIELASDQQKNTLMITPSEAMLVRIYDASETLRSEVYVQKYGMEINLSSLEKGRYRVKGIHSAGTINEMFHKN